MQRMGRGILNTIMAGSSGNTSISNDDIIDFEREFELFRATFRTHYIERRNQETGELEWKRFDRLPGAGMHTRLIGSFATI